VLSTFPVLANVPLVRTDLSEIIIAEADFDSIDLYTAGSNQEWALGALSQFDNNEEMIRLYNFLLWAHSFLMVYDDRDFIMEYYEIMNLWLNTMRDFNEEHRASLQAMIDDEMWTIDIAFPLETPFDLSHDEFSRVYTYFSEANPQFFLNQINPAVFHSDEGLMPKISIQAYYAFATRRREAHEAVLHSFDNFKVRMEESIDMSAKFSVLSYVYDYVTAILSHDFHYVEPPTRESIANDRTILGFFGGVDPICRGNAATLFMYLLNRLGIPTIPAMPHAPAMDDPGGFIFVRNENGEKVSEVRYAWNVIMLDDVWHFLGASLSWSLHEQWRCSAWPIVK